MQKINTTPTFNLLRGLYVDELDTKMTLNSSLVNKRQFYDECNTTTFYLRIPGGTQKSIVLEDIETMPDGSYIISTSVVKTDDTKVGLLILLSNDGTILYQKEFKVNNQDVRLSKIKVRLDGSFVISGIMADASNKVFFADLNNDLSIRWLQTFVMSSTPLNVTADILETTSISFAVQLSGTIIYGLLGKTGNVMWQKEILPTVLQNIAGFSGMNFGKIGLAANCLNGGRQVVILYEVDEANGQILSSYELGNGIDEKMTLALGSFGNRLQLVMVNKAITTNYSLERDIFFGASTIETKHNYTPTANINFNFSSAAIDNSGDIIALCTSQDGKLILTKHYAQYNTNPTFTASYDVPVGASVAAVARSFDGGVLCGLNSVSKNELILIKTDSIGVLAGCGYTNILNPVTELLQVDNVMKTATEANITINATSSTIILSNGNLNSQFDCSQKYCPSVVDADTCMSTYFKTFRSNSYIDLFNDYFLMRNNRHIVVTRRYDRIIGTDNTIAGGLKLFDESGKFIKGVTVYQRGKTTDFWAHAMNDKSILLVINSSDNNIGSHTLVLVSDNLDILWTKSFQMDGTIINGTERASEIIMDEKGDIYLVGFTGGYMGDKPQLGVTKLDRMGNLIWIKKYEMGDGPWGAVAVAYSNTALYAIVSGSGKGSVSVKLNKQNGQVLNSYNFINLWSGGINRRYAKFEKDRIVYVGDDTKGNVILGLFDSSGAPLKMKTLNNSSIPRAANFSEGVLCVTYTYFNGSSNVEVLVKADTALNILFVKEYDDLTGTSRIPKNLYISNEGNVYIGGNISNPTEMYPYIMKLDKDGNRGTCNSVTPALNTSEVNLRGNVLAYSTLISNMIEYFVPVHFTADYNGLKIGNVLCQSIPQCTFIKLNGPDTVCLSDNIYNYTFSKPVGCTNVPQWIADTSFLKILNISDAEASVRFKKAGIVDVFIQLNSGCVATRDSIRILVQGSANTLNLGIDRALCPGDTIRLNAGQGFSSYKWQNSTLDSILLVTQPGIYGVEVTNACGGVLADTISVASANIPLLTIGEDTTVCIGATVNFDASIGFSQYQWTALVPIYNQGANINLLINQPQVLSVKAITADGCSSVDSINIDTKIPFPFSLGNDTSFCASDYLLLTPGKEYQSYIWNDGSTGATYLANKAGYYWANAKDTNGCIATDTILIKTVYPLPSVNLGKDFDLCEGVSVHLDAGDFSSYKWMDGTSIRYYSVDKPGEYYIKVTNQFGCNNSDTVIVRNLLSPPSNFLPATDSICQYENIFVGSLNAFQSYMWSNGSTLPGIEISQPGNYILTVKDFNGCSGTDTISVMSKNCMLGLFIPNTFTPNGDNINDIFRAKIYGKVAYFQFEIYDRFGNLIFKTVDYKTGWDGKVKGIPSPSGVFVWQCFYQFEGENKLYKKGNVTLLR